MSPTSSRPFLRLAIAGALVAALGLAGCGRKGPLDPPPGAATEATEPAQRSGLASPVGISPLGGGGQSQGGGEVGPDGRPVIKGPKKNLPIDVLLN